MDTYQFSQVYHASAVAFSPGSTFIALGVGEQLVIRSTANLDILRAWTVTPPEETAACLKHADRWSVDRVQWSQDGLRILAFSTKLAQGCIFALEYAEAIGYLGGDLSKVEWGGEDVLSWSDRGISMHDMSTGRSRFIQNATEAYSWSPDGRYLALAESHHGQHHIGIYDRESLIRIFPVDMTEPAGLSWSPCGRWIAAWDWRLTYSVHFYSPVGSRLGGLSLSTTSAQPSDIGLGIRTVAWSPNGRFIAVGDFEGGVRVLESESWSPIATLRGFDGPVWREPGDSLWSGSSITQFQLGSAPAARTSVSFLGFMPDATLLFFAHQAALHVYSFLPDPTASVPEINHIATVGFQSPISAARCCPTTNRIAIATRARAVYMWDTFGVEGVGVPNGRNFATHNVIWAPDGRTAALCDKGSFCLVYEDPPDMAAGDDWEEPEPI